MVLLLSTDSSNDSRMSAEPPKRGELKIKLKCKLICNKTRGNYEVDIWASTHGQSKLQG